MSGASGTEPGGPHDTGVPHGPDPGAFAELLAGYCLDVQAGEQVLVRSTTLAAPLLLALQEAILARGAWPLLRASLPGQAAGWYGAAGDAQLDEIAPLELEEARQADRSLSIQAPEDVRALADVDPERIARAGRARHEARELTLGRTWATTIWPTDALASQAGLEPEAFAAFVRRATFLDRPDPVGAWRALAEFQARLIERLADVRELRIEAEDTDLRVRVGGRTWVNSDGRRNMPSGEVFTGPLEDSAEGTIRFDVPASPAGVDVTGVRLTFRAGEVVDARADRGQDYLERALRTDPGARRLGEIGIGTNYGIEHPSGVILLDEKIGGTVHLALGRSYPETGGTTVSALHWDLVRDLRQGGRLLADGEVLQEDGRFVGL